MQIFVYDWEVARIAMGPVGDFYLGTRKSRFERAEVGEDKSLSVYNLVLH